MTESGEMEDYKTRLWGARFGYRTPPPEFAKSHTEPLSPLLTAAAMAVARDEDVSDQHLATNNNFPLTITPAPLRESLFSTYMPSSYSPSRLAVTNALAVNYASMDPMQLFADIALSTAPPGFMTARSSPASHALAAPPLPMRSPSIPALSNSSGLSTATWAADGYPTRNGNNATGYPTNLSASHAMVGDTFGERSYTFERRGSAVRLEPPPGVGFPSKKSIMTATGGSHFPRRGIPEVTARPPLPVSFAPGTSVYSSAEPLRRTSKKDTKATSARGGSGTGGGAGSTRDARGSRNNARGRSSSSKSTIPHRGRASGSSPTREPVEMDKSFQTQARPESLNYKVAGVAVTTDIAITTDVVITADATVTKAEPILNSPVHSDKISAPAVGPNDPPSPSPAYSPFPSRHASPLVETSYITPPVSEEVDHASESKQEVVVSEPVKTAQGPDVELLIQDHKPISEQTDKSSLSPHIPVEQTSKDVSMDDVQSAVPETPAEENTNNIAQEVPVDVQQLVAIYDKPHESPDSGIISGDGLMMEDVRDLTKEVAPDEPMVEPNVITEAEVVVSREEVPAIEPVGDENTTAIAPVIVNEEQLVQIDVHEKVDDIMIEEALNAPVHVQITVDDISFDDIPFVDIPPAMNEDYEVSHPNGDEPVFGTTVDTCGVPHEIFDSASEVESTPIEAAAPKGLRVLSPSGGLAREPENPDEEFCAHCDAKYRNGHGFRLDINSWIGCDGCRTWYHSTCVGLDSNAVRRIDKYYCQKCEPMHGVSTMKRTSAREKTAIDYNALHNGSSAPIKNPTDSKLHPYVAIIRDRTHTFAEDTLPRMSPEQVTEETIENMSGGWNQPFVVPAEGNPAPWISPKSVQTEFIEARDAQPEEMDIDRPEPATVIQAGDSDQKLRPPPPPLLSSPSRDSSPGKKSKHSKTGTPEMTLDNGDFDQTEVDRIKSSLVEGEYEVNVRRAGADCLDMIIPEGLTVRKVSELIGHQMRVEMINVLKQSTTRDDKWQMENLVEYFESKNRDEIYNCISCEVTKTPMGPMISPPEVVRKMDLSDRVWRSANDNDSKPHVGKYVLMSVADSFTDFHIDFAGSSVFYHIYEGQKVFLILPPTEKNLETYEQWSMDQNMNTTFFPTLVDDPCMLVTLNKGDTLFVPSGWIHAVYTPQDSLVIGGNFLTRSHYAKQMAIQRIEVVTDTKLSQRYPKYTTLMWHCLYNYLVTDPIPDGIDQALAAGRIIRQKKYRPHKDTPRYTKQELEGLPDLCNFLLRTALIHCGSIKTSLRPGKPMLTSKQVEAVRRAIPTPCFDDPLKWVKKFGRWCVWKRACAKIEEKGERVPEWAQGKWIPEEGPKKGLSVTTLRRLERKKVDEARRAEAPRRAGLRERIVRESTESTEGVNEDAGLSEDKTARKKRKSDGDIEMFAPKKKGRPSKPPSTPGQSTTSILGGMFDGIPGSKRKNKNKSKEKKLAVLDTNMDGESYALSDGAVYVAKQSNLGPARAGCQNCRLKKTGCKHKAEISELITVLQVNDGLLPPGTIIAGHEVVQLPRGTSSGAAKKMKVKVKGKGKGKGKGKVVTDLTEIYDDPEEGDEEVEEVEEDDVTSDEEDEEPVEIYRTPRKEELDDDWNLDEHTAEEPDTYGDAEEQYIPKTAPSSGGSSSGSTSNKRTRLLTEEHAEEAPGESPPKKIKVFEVLTTPIVNTSGVVGRPPGFQGRKPSCDECKALKTKCLHDTWYLAKVKSPTKTPKNSRRKSGKLASARAAANRRLRLGAEDAMHVSAPGTNAEPMDLADFQDGIQISDGHEDLEDVIVCKKPMAVTSTIKATAARHHTLPVASTDPYAAGPSTTWFAYRVATPPPPTSTSSVKSSPLSEPNTFDLDLSMLDDQILYKSRSSNTPDDPTIMGPPVDIDDEPTVQLPARVITYRAPPATATMNLVPNPMMMAGANNYPRASYRVNKPKVTYTRTNKNFKRKADDDEIMDTTEDHDIKQVRTGTSMSPEVENGAGSVAGGEDSPTVEELIRLGAAAEFGLRRRAGS